MSDVFIEEGLIETAIDITKKVKEFRFPYSKDYFEKIYTGKKKLILISYIEKIPVGYIISYEKDNDGSFYCSLAGVDPDYRRQGVLNMMMEYLFDWARKHNYTRIKLKTRNRHRNMLSFLVKNSFNFTKVDTREFIGDYHIYLEKEI